MITLKDANGNYVCVKQEELDRYFNSNSLIFGMSLDEVGRLRELYIYLGGSFPVDINTIVDNFTLK